ncbi:hypothetical protein OCU04_008812 [Sclerotinia nivalis]|uniref:2EXR domain-containing protein n=1 Tax=Sclerotinia nivalis TaxID=352851 RepID=A0A9X0AG84_9HELO|nr:hypothetical protein OCU04_008812 [Sclerotinia nivalis]
MDFQNLFSEVNGERNSKHDIIEEEVDLYMASFKIDANERLEKFLLDAQQHVTAFQRRKNASLEAFDRQGDKLRVDFADELRLRQRGFYYEEKKREDEFHEEQQRMKKKFDDAEQILHTKFKSQFFEQLLKNGVSSTRRLTQPAYIFERFPDLPEELQMNIWFMAAHDKNTDRHPFVHYGNWDDLYEGFHRDVSSAISIGYTGNGLLQPGYKPSSNKYNPAVLQACRLAREVAKTVYTCLPVEYGEKFTDEGLSRQAYFDLVNDEFFLSWKRNLGRSRWAEHRIIVDLLVKHHATKDQWQSLPVALRKHIENLLEIRNLQIDLRVLYNIPPHIWAEFSKLDCLTILMPPTKNHEISVHNRAFKPKDGTKFGKRADWIWGYCYKLLSSVKKDFPDWRHPKIKVHLVDDLKCEETYEEASPEEYDEVHSHPPPGDTLHNPFPNYLDHSEMIVFPTRNSNVYLPEDYELDEDDDLEWYRMNRLPKFSFEVTKKDMQYGHRWPFDEDNDVDDSEGSD